MVRCTDCGFLAVRHKVQRNLCEVEGDVREKGQWPVAPGTGNAFALYESIPVCFVCAAQLSEEMKGGGSQSFLEVIRRDRDCNSFTPWKQGFSPREHKEMLDNKELREWQEARRKEDQAFQERTRTEEHAFQLQLRAEEHAFQLGQKRNDKKWQVVMVLVGACLTALGAAIIRWFG